LKEAAEKAKIELSSMTTTNINLPFISVDATGPKHLDLTLSQAKFNEMTADLVHATMGPVDQALRDSGLSPSDLDKVLLVGGSSRIPAVQEAVKARIGKEPFKGINPDECVALGAAYQGGILGGDVTGGLLLLELLQRNKYGGRINDELCPTVAAVQQVAVAECFAQVGGHRNAASDYVWLVNDLSCGAIFRCKRHSLLADADVQAIAKSRFHLFGFIAFGCKVNDK
jgi:hypothetical protein